MNPEAASHPEFERELRNFLDSENRVLVLAGMFGQSMPFVVELAANATRTKGTAPTVVAPAARIAGGYSAGCLSIYGLLYDPHAKYDDIGRQFVHSRKQNGDDRYQVYIVGDAHLVSSKYTQIDSRRFGSGHLLDDLMAFLDLDGSSRRIIFIGDPYQLARGRRESTPLSEQILKKYSDSVQRVNLEKFNCTRTPALLLENRRLLADRIRTRRFHSLSIRHDSSECVQLSDLPADINRLVKDHEATLIAFKHAQVNKYNSTIRCRAFGFGPSLTANDLVVSYNHLKFECGSCGKFYTIPNGSFGIVQTVRKEEPVVQRLKGRDEPIRVEFLRVWIRWRGGCCDDVSESLCFRDFLYAEKPELGADHWLALVVHARKSSSDPDRIGETRRLSSTIRKPSAKKIEPEAIEDQSEEPVPPNDPWLNAAKIRFGYAITVHRAQGCQFESIIADLSQESVLGGRGYLSWLYTAFSVPYGTMYLIHAPEKHALDNTVWQFDRSRLVKKVQPQSLINYDPHAPETNDTIDFPADQLELRNLYRYVGSQIEQIGGRISKLVHYQYQEVYSFELNSVGTCTLGFHYNGKFKITKITALKSYPPEASRRIKDALASEPNFENAFQKELYEEFSARLEPYAIRIYAVDRHSFQEVYFVRGDDGSAKLRAHYTKSGAVTKIVLDRHTNDMIVNELASALKP